MWFMRVHLQRPEEGVRASILSPSALLPGPGSSPALDGGDQVQSILLA